MNKTCGKGSKGMEDLVVFFKLTKWSKTYRKKKKNVTLYFGMDLAKDNEKGDLQ